MIRIIRIFFLIILLSIASKESDADVYSYASDDGSVCFTDSPSKKGAVIVLRDTRSPAKSSRKAFGTNRTPSNTTAPSVQSLRKSPGRKNQGLPVNGVISSATGLRIDPFSGQMKNHNGIDLAVAQGTPVRPVIPGVVTYSGNRNGYGNLVIIDHEDGLVTLYAHNSQNMVSTGERVALNSVIALTGSTGRSTGPHLHFEAWRHGENVTPEFLPESWGPRRFSQKSFARTKSYPVRKVIMADGSIILTNLPLAHP